MPSIDEIRARWEGVSRWYRYSDIRYYSLRDDAPDDIHGLLTALDAANQRIAELEAAQPNPMVVVDPRYRFGRPQVGGVETRVIAGVYRAGETDIALLAEDYGLTAAEVCVALAWEGVYIDRRSNSDVVEWCVLNPGRCSDEPIRRGKPIPARGLPDA